MGQFQLNFLMTAATAVLFSAMLAVNDALFLALEFEPGVNWIYLPAGMRLLCTLLFGGAGAVGLLIVSWLVCFLVFFPDDSVRAFMGGLIAAAAPYLVYLAARHLYGLQASLANLTPRRLLACVLAYSLASPLLHHLWFWLHGDGHHHHLLRSLGVMIAGDLAGTLIVVYAAKGLLALLAHRRAV